MSAVFSRKCRWGRIDITAGDEFLATSSQVRPWFFHRLLSETVADLEALDEMKGSLVAGSGRPLIGGSGWSQAAAEYSAGELIIAGQQVMQDWESPLMEAMADIAAASHGDVLEVGFGMGISAT